MYIIRRNKSLQTNQSACILRDDRASIILFFAFLNLTYIIIIWRWRCLTSLIAPLFTNTFPMYHRCLELILSIYLRYSIVAATFIYPPICKRFGHRLCMRPIHLCRRLCETPPRFQIPSLLLIRVEIHACHASRLIPWELLKRTSPTRHWRIAIII